LPARLNIDVAADSVSEFGESPSSEDFSESRLAQIDFTIRVPAKMCDHLIFQHIDLVAYLGQNGHQGAGGCAVGLDDLW
jgi:hypothetical protein